MPTITERSTDILNAEVNAELRAARTGGTPRVLTPAEVERIDAAERLAGIRDAAAVARAGSGGSGMRTD